MMCIVPTNGSVTRSSTTRQKEESELLEAIYLHLLDAIQESSEQLRDDKDVVLCGGPARLYYKDFAMSSEIATPKIDVSEMFSLEGRKNSANGSICKCDRNDSRSPNLI